MSAAASTATSTTTPAAAAGVAMSGPYLCEVRFGVVMYGGVSLAIYINGVANELYEMARATPRAGTPERAQAASGTREVYAWLSALMADSGLLDACRAHLQAELPLREFFDQRAGVLARAPRVRLVVDVISGTSAGGINGVFLAKALANNEAFSLLKDLWVHEGDIGKLLNDEGSRVGDRALPAIAKHPVSLLNSDRMYAKLLKALNEMSKTRQSSDPAAANAQSAPSACADEIDLFVTTTDIRGATISLRLFDKLVPERRHRQVFRFRYRASEQRNDFEDGNRSFLAYAARCTSSFPFAFEPMTLKAAERIAGRVGEAMRKSWRDLFVAARGAESDTDPLERAYGDGGYLDNKPFSHAIEALAQREAEVPVERKLIYIEPSPQHPEDDDRAARAAGRETEPPNPVSNALAALTEIPRHETIREDLESVLARNRLIERVDRIVSQGERDLELGGDTDPYVQALAHRADKRKAWNDMTLADLREFYGDAFMPYRRLRVSMVTDKLADRLAQLWGVDPDSDRLYALRALVRVWREINYSDVDSRKAGTPTLNSFLDRFDLRFRTRRLRFLIRRVDALYRLLLKREAGGLNEPVSSLSRLHQTLLERLQKATVNLAAPQLTNFDIERGRQVLVELRQDFIRSRDQTRSAELDLLKLGGPDAPALRERLGGLLTQTLDLLLDTGASTQPSQPAPGGANELRLADFLPAEVKLKLTQASKLPSATRTLQERVYQRAQLLYLEMRNHGATPLQNALEGDLDAIGALVTQVVEGTPERPALAIVGARLGHPDWDFVDTASATGVAGVFVAGTSATGAAPQAGDAPKMLAVPVVRETGNALLDSVEGKLLRRLLATYFLRYDSYDQMSLPLYYGTNVGEPSTVEVVRVSPEDATALIDERNDERGRKKLAGTTLANFGGFLDAQWRRNDILWGRFDGAERLIHTLMPQPENASVRRELTRAAHLAIANDDLAPGERAEVTALMMQALDKLGATADARVKTLLAQLDTSDPARRKRVEHVLTMLFEGDGLLRYVSETRDVDRRLDPKRALGHAARAATVAGRVLEGVSEGKDVQSVPRWLTRAGLVAQGLVAVSLPGSLLTLLWRHWLTLAYLLELVMFVLGVLFSSPEMRSVGLTAFALTAVAHVATVALRDVMRERAPWKSRALWVVLMLAIALAAIGAWTLNQVPLGCLRPATKCAAPVKQALAAPAGSVIVRAV